MARTVEQIRASIYEKIEAKDDLKDLFDNPSQTKLWGEIVFAVSVGIAIHEQIMDEHLTRVTDSSNTVYNVDWLRERIFEFQYDSTTPQVVALNSDLVPEYPTVDETLQIISVCNLYLGANNVFSVKVAKNDPPEKLTAGELTAFQDYLTDGGSSTALGLGIGVTGCTNTAVSDDPDYIWLEADVWYDGEYSSTISSTVQAAIVNYYHNLDGQGYLRVTDLEEVIKSVPGVIYVDIENLGIRANATAFGSKTLLVDSFETLLRESQAAAGYAYEEVTASEDLATKLSFFTFD